ncbi:unnamed protein product [Pseudo-nitzschia multistriata]|uniref:Uncharacterized protein n=1 Tax=Pseudo-nitzschia multistriata TaxID=183589 RepID=A0A448ZA66_9STRA|nr:unnamed protein product [Pseudo-nitzschia multistriata]
MDQGKRGPTHPRYVVLSGITCSIDDTDHLIVAATVISKEQILSFFVVVADGPNVGREGIAPRNRQDRGVVRTVDMVFAAVGLVGWRIGGLLESDVFSVVGPVNNQDAGVFYLFFVGAIL